MRPIARVSLFLLAACGQAPGPGSVSNDTAPLAGTDRPGAPSEVVVRRVWADDGVDFLGSPSPDGRAFSFQDDTTLGLAVHHLLTGEKTLIAGDSTVQQYALNSLFSSDGRWLAYTWFNEDQRIELRIVGADGVGARTLYRDDDFIDYAWPAAWSPDGRAVLAVVQATDRAARFALVDVESGTPRILKSFDWRTPTTASFAPDGRSIAYDFPPDQESPARDLYLLDLERGRETRLTHDPADQQLLGWLPDGSGVLYTREQEGSTRIWHLPLRDGRRAGEPTLVHTDPGRIVPLGTSRTALFYGLGVEEPQLYLAAFDGPGGSVVGSPVPISEAALGRAIAPAWSPDGSHLAYAVRPSGGGRATLQIRSMETGAVRSIAPPIAGIRRLSWAPDGKALYAAGWDRGPSGVFRIDLTTAAARQLVRIEPAILLSPVLSPDGRRLYFSRYDPPTNRGTIFVYDLVAEEERVLHSTDGRISNLVRSPDGRSLAFSISYNGTRLMRMPHDGSAEPRLLLELEGFAIDFDTLNWSPDGRFLLFVRNSESAGGVAAIERIPATGGEPERLLEMRGIGRLRVHPDGRRVIFRAGEFKGEVWTMENLPGAR